MNERRCYVTPSEAEVLGIAPRQRVARWVSRAMVKPAASRGRYWVYDAFELARLNAQADADPRSRNRNRVGGGASTHQGRANARTRMVKAVPA